MGYHPSESVVQRLDRPDARTFARRCVDAGRPGLLRGVVPSWPAASWRLDGLASRLGAREVSPVVLTDGRFVVDLREGVRVKPMPVAEYLAHLAAPGAPPYYLRLPLEGDLAALSREAPVDAYCVGSVAQKRNLWVGAAGTCSDLHFDMTHNLVAQISGRRRVTLFAPDQRVALYPHPLRSLNAHHSQVRLDAPDLARFPRFAEARGEAVALEAGELLFIPRGWWHHFESLAPSIAVNAFWATPAHVPALLAARAAWTLAAVRT
ncbi:MAG: cupin-like domain-containing protein [Polyangiales bacterium]